MQQTLLVFLCVLLLSLVHLNAANFRRIPLFRYSVWVSLAAGVSVSYVFLMLLPKLAQSDVVLANTLDNGDELKYQAFFLAMFGLVAFYGVEKALSKAARESRPENLAAIFWARVGLFALYNIPIGYLISYQLQQGGERALFLYIIAIALHLIVVDSALLKGHHGKEAMQARIVLALGLLTGWLCSVLALLSEPVLAAIMALLAGAMMLVVLKEELPTQRESHFISFAVGAFSYALLLVMI